MPTSIDCGGKIARSNAPIVTGRTSIREGMTSTDPGVHATGATAVLGPLTTSPTSASSYRALKGYVHDFVNHTQKEYARGDVHEKRAKCLFSLLKPGLRVLRGLSQTNLPGYLGFFQFLRNFHQLTACEQAELSLHAA